MTAFTTRLAFLEAGSTCCHKNRKKKLFNTKITGNTRYYQNKELGSDSLKTSLKIFTKKYYMVLRNTKSADG